MTSLLLHRDVDLLSQTESTSSVQTVKVRIMLIVAIEATECTYVNGRKSRKECSTTRVY
jgi:hypothetical protein